MDTSYTRNPVNYSAATMKLTNKVFQFLDLLFLVPEVLLLFLLHWLFNGIYHMAALSIITRNLQAYGLLTALTNFTVSKH